MANSGHLNRHLLRTILLEGENGELILRTIRKFAEGAQGDEDRHRVVDVIKKEITKTARVLASDASVDNFIQEVTSQL